MKLLSPEHCEWRGGDLKQNSASRGELKDGEDFREQPKMILFRWISKQDLRDMGINIAGHCLLLRVEI